MGDDLAEILVIKEVLESFSRNNKLSSEIIFELKLSLEEVFVNIVQYGFDDNGKHIIEIDIHLQEDKIILRVVDDGKYFNPVLLDTSPDRISPENRAEGGMGISILKNLMSDIQYSRVENKNILVFEKKIV